MEQKIKFKEHLDNMIAEEEDPILKIYYQTALAGMKGAYGNIMTKEEAYKSIIICLGTNLNSLINQK
jgi:hypothetical protein